MADRQAAPQADAARHADTIREGRWYAEREDHVSAEASVAIIAALDALVARVAAAEQERDEARERVREQENEIVDVYHPRAQAAVARADRLETALREMEKGTYRGTLTMTDEDLRLREVARAALASPAPDPDGLTIEPMDLGVEIDNEKVDAEIKIRAQVRGSYFPDIAAPDRAEAATHGRHCSCSACAKEDWTRADLAPCGIHGPDCPNVYAPDRTEAE